jgi:hypothetical protein
LVNSILMAQSLSRWGPIRNLLFSTTTHLNLLFIRYPEVLFRYICFQYNNLCFFLPLFPPVFFFFLVCCGMFTGF